MSSSKAFRLPPALRQHRDKVEAGLWALFSDASEPPVIDGETITVRVPLSDQAKGLLASLRQRWPGRSESSLLASALSRFQ